MTKLMQEIALYKYFSTLLFAVLLTVASSMPESAVSAEIGYYKWTDKKGYPHHSDRPPAPGIEYEFIGTESGLRRHVTAEESRDEGRPSAPGTRNPTEAEQRAIERAVAVVKDPALCDQAKANIDTLNSKARVRIRDADGGIRYLDEEERDVQRRKARDLMVVHCN